MTTHNLTIAVEGCLHGELDAVYAAIREVESNSNSREVDLLLVCGGFESLVEESDLDCMAVPEKYRKMNEFRDYVSGVKKAHCPTIFVGGNHEASNKLQALFYGGYVAPDIYFLGFAGCIRFKGLRIAGISGIFNRGHYHLGHYEKPPYTTDSLRSVYHTREQDILRLSKLGSSVDIVLSHDWPQGVWNYGDVDSLLKKKPFFREDITTGNLGSPPLADIMSTLRPKYWFAAHLHTKFTAVIPWLEPSFAPSTDDDGEGEGEGDINVAGAGPICTPCAPASCTRFLALDKVIPGRDFLQLLSVPSPPPMSEKDSTGNIEYDLEWLSIVSRTHHLLDTSAQARVDAEALMKAAQWSGHLEESEIQRLRGLVTSAPGAHGLTIPNVAPVVLQPTGRRGRPQQKGNAQTDRFLAMLNLPHIWTVPNGAEAQPQQQQQPPPPPPPPPHVPTPQAAVAAEREDSRDSAEIDIDLL